MRMLHAWGTQPGVVVERLEKVGDPAARDLVSKLLQREPSARLSVKDALEHVFFRTGRDGGHVEPQEKVLEELRLIKEEQTRQGEEQRKQTEMYAPPHERALSRGATGVGKGNRASAFLSASPTGRQGIKDAIAAAAAETKAKAEVAKLVEAKRAARMRQVLAKAIAASLDSFGEEEMRLCFQKLLRDRPDLEPALLEWRTKLLASVKGGLERRFAHRLARAAPPRRSAYASRSPRRSRWICPRSTKSKARGLPGARTQSRREAPAHAERRAGEQGRVGAELLADGAVAGAGQEQPVLVDDDQRLELPLVARVLELVAEGVVAVGAAAGAALLKHPDHRSPFGRAVGAP